MQETISATDETNFETRPSRPRKAVYTIVERENGEKGFWVRLGTAYVNRDNSLNVYLNALPTNGQLHIRSFPD